MVSDCANINNDTVIYWLIPILVYALVFSPSFVGRNSNIEQMLYFYSEIGAMLQNNNILPIVIALIILGVLVFINQKVQLSYIEKEISSSKNPTKHQISTFSF